MRSMSLRKPMASNGREPRRSSRLQTTATLQATKSRALKLVKAQEKRSLASKVKRAPPTRKPKPLSKAGAKAKTPTKATAKITTKIKAKATSKATKLKTQLLAQVQPKRIPAGQQECLICAEIQPLGRGNSNFPQFTNCSHPANTCSTCISKVVTNFLSSTDVLVHDSATNAFSVDWTRCICSDCDQSLPESEIRSRLSRRQVSSIDSVIKNKIQEADGDWIRCLSARCSARQKVDPAAIAKLEKPIVTCVGCGARSCYYHRVPWHRGSTCEKYDDKHPMAQSIRSSEERIKRISKKCPNRKCGWRIQKNGGCDHIICTGCNRHIDWAKLPWDKGVTPESEMQITHATLMFFPVRRGAA